MKRLLALLPLFLLAASPLLAQFPQHNEEVTLSDADPTGACSDGRAWTNTATDARFHCYGKTWHEAAAGASFPLLGGNGCTAPPYSFTSAATQGLCRGLAAQWGFDSVVLQWDDFETQGWGTNHQMFDGGALQGSLNSSFNGASLYYQRPVTGALWSNFVFNAAEFTTGTGASVNAAGTADQASGQGDFEVVVNSDPSLVSTMTISGAAWSSVTEGVNADSTLQLADSATFDFLNVTDPDETDETVITRVGIGGGEDPDWRVTASNTVENSFVRVSTFGARLASTGSATESTEIRAGNENILLRVKSGTATGTDMELWAGRLTVVDETKTDFALMTVGGGPSGFANGKLRFQAVDNVVGVSQSHVEEFIFSCAQESDVETCSLVSMGEAKSVSAGTLDCAIGIDTDETQAVMWHTTCDQETGDSAVIFWWWFETFESPNFTGQ